VIAVIPVDVADPAEPRQNPGAQILEPPIPSSAP